jgi:methyl-accepting chemotaxis protein
MKTTVGMKIGGGMSVALAALLIIGGVAYWSIVRLIADAAWVTHTYRVLEQLDRVLSDLQDVETGARGYVITGSDSFLDPYQRAGAAMDDAYLSSLRALTADSPAQQQRLIALESLIRERLRVAQVTITTRKDKGLEAAVQTVLIGTGKNVMDQIRTVVGEMKDEENRLIGERSRAARASSRRAMAVIEWGVPLTLAALGLIAWLLTRSVTRPLEATAAVAERMAQGDLSVEPPDNQRQDEVGALLHAFARMIKFQRQMAGVAEQIASGDLRVKLTPQSDKDVLGRAFASMVANLQQLTADVTEAVNVLGSAASEIVASTTQLTATATETATAVTETTTTVEEVRHTAQLSNQKVQSVSDSAQKAAVSTQAGKHSTEESVEGMKRIRQQMESIADSMVRFSEQTQSIGQILASVDDLAAQSNILAVNAAIEAAKAGEQGKGFAVVAQEVKSLAEQSRQATNQVRTILHDIQKATSAAVMATEQGSRVVESGLAQSTQAGASIEALAAAVGEAAQAATQIAASNQQQLVGVEQVALAMGNIRQSSDQNAENARQMEASARNLDELGRSLKRLVATYKMGEREATGQPEGSAKG